MIEALIKKERESCEREREREREKERKRQRSGERVREREEQKKISLLYFSYCYQLEHLFNQNQFGLLQYDNYTEI